MSAAKLELEPHYFRTSPACKTVEECWKELGGYLAKHASNRLVFFRDTPEVLTEREFDTKRERHVGYVRFSAGPKQERQTVIVGLGNAVAKA